MNSIALKCIHLSFSRQAELRWLGKCQFRVLSTHSLSLAGWFCSEFPTNDCEHENLFHSSTTISLAMQSAGWCNIMAKWSWRWVEKKFILIGFQTNNDPQLKDIICRRGSSSQLSPTSSVSSHHHHHYVDDSDISRESKEKVRKSIFSILIRFLVDRMSLFCGFSLAPRIFFIIFYYECFTCSARASFSFETFETSARGSIVWKRKTRAFGTTKQIILLLFLWKGNSIRILRSFFAFPLQTRVRAEIPHRNVNEIPPHILVCVTWKWEINHSIDLESSRRVFRGLFSTFQELWNHLVT